MQRSISLSPGTTNTKDKSPKRKVITTNWFAKYKAQIEAYKTANLRKELEIEGSYFDETDDKFVAPAVLTKEGDLNLDVLFKYELQPGDRRHLLRQMEKAREEFRDRILVETRRKQEEERKRLEEAEDEKEIRLVKERFRAIQEKLSQKADETAKFQLSAKEKEIQEIRQQEEMKQKRLEEEMQMLQTREWDRLRRLPDYPTTFTVCRRLHSPARNNNYRQHRFEENAVEKDATIENKTPLSKTMMKARRKSLALIEQQQQLQETEAILARKKPETDEGITRPTELVSVSYSVSTKHDGQLELVTLPV